MDKAHKQTDLKLEEIEKRLTAIYKRANKEIVAIADEYFKQFEKQDKEQLKLLSEGKITEKEYKQWRKNKMMTGKRYKDMKEQTAEQLLHINETALAYINGELPEIYALNYNHLAEAVDGVGGYSFTLTDADTIRNLAIADKTLLPYKYVNGVKDVRWNTKKVNAEVLQGIIQGDSINKIADRLQRVTEMNRTSAIRNARTTVTSAECKGRQDSYTKASKDGIILKKEWMATNDKRTRHWHADLNGVQVGVDESFYNDFGEIKYPGDVHANPANVYNCFVGTTKIASDSETVRSYKHKYSGKLVTVKTSSGVEFTCTPNHPILTPSGWVAAELLQNGNNILVTRCSNNRLLRVNPNIKHTFPRMDTFHNLLDMSFGKRTTSMSVDFHGDIPTTNVEIVTQKRFLWKDRNSSLRNCFGELAFKLTDKAFSFKCSFVKHFRRICKTSFSFVSGLNKLFSFFNRSVCHSDIHGSRPVSDRNVILSKYSIDDLPAKSIIDGELLNRLSSDIFLDKIVSVDVVYSDTHVYNLQTVNGYYFVNSIIPQNEVKSNGFFAIAKNCRCTTVARVLGFVKAKVENAVENVEKAMGNLAEFKPAETVKNALLYAENFADKIDLGGIKIEQANFLNQALHKLYSQHPINKFKEIVKSKRNSIAAANGESLEINLKKFGKQQDDTFTTTQLFRKYELDSLKDKYKGKTPSKKDKEKIDELERSLKFERWSPSNTAETTIYHEYGHAFADQNFGSVVLSSWNDKFVEGTERYEKAKAKRELLQSTYEKAKEEDIFKIGKYADTNADEFFAEVFSMKIQGEELPDYIEKTMEELLK